MLSAETGKVFYNNRFHKIVINILAHSFEVRAVVIRTGVTVVNIKFRVWKMVFLNVFRQIFLLVYNAVAFALVLVALRLEL